MAERDLVIRTAVTGAAESKAQLDSVKQSTESLVNSVSAAQANLQSAFAALGEGGLGKGFENVDQFRLAIAEADRAVVGLRDSIATARAQGHPIPAGAEEALERYGKAVGVAWQASNSWTFDNRATAASVEAVTQAVVPAAAAASELAEAAGLSAAQLKLLQQGAGLSATQLAALGQQTGFTATETAALTRGAVSLQAALAGEAVSARAAAVAVDAHVVAFRAQQAASAEVVAGLQSVRAAFAANTATVMAGGRNQAAAMTAIAAAVGKVVLSMEAAKLAGGIVTPAQQLALDGYILKLRSLAVSSGLVAGEVAKSGAAMAGATTSTRLYTAATAQAGQAIAGKTVNLGAMSGALLRSTGAIGGMVAGAALLPSLLDSIDKATQAWSNALVDLVTGIYDEDVAVRKLTDAVKQANASSDLYRIAQGSLAVGTRDVRDAIRDLGFEIGEGFSASLSKANDFISAYNSLLKAEGPAAAKEFAELNKKYIGEAIDAFAALGKAVPVQLRAIADELGILSEKEKEFASNRQLSEKWAEEMSAANLLIGIIRTSITAKEDEFAVTGRLAKQINEEITALENLKTTTEAQEGARKAALQTLVDLAVKHGILTSKLRELANAAKDANAVPSVPKTVAEGADEAVAQVDALINKMNELAQATKLAQAAAEAAFGAGPIPEFGHSPLVGAFSQLNTNQSNLAPNNSNARSTAGPAVGWVNGRQVIGS